MEGLYKYYAAIRRLNPNGLRSQAVVHGHNDQKKSGISTYANRNNIRARRGAERLTANSMELSSRHLDVLGVRERHIILNC
jgi:hypothetical protein